MVTKKSIIFLAVAILSSVVFNAGATQDKPTISIPKATRSVVIDGDLKEYTGVKPSIVMDAQSFEKLGYDPWNGKRDLSADIYFLWDDKNLYVAARITDNVPFTNSREANDIWDGDCVELTLGMDEGADPERSAFGEGDYQIGLSPGNAKDIKPSDWIWNRYDYKGGIEVASASAKDGYTIEARVPFKVLNGYKPAIGKSFDLDIAIDDADISSRKTQFVWTGTKYFYISPAEWGRAVLVAAAPALAFSTVITVIIGIIMIMVFIIFAVHRSKR